VLRVQNDRSFSSGIQSLREAESAQPDLDRLLGNAFLLIRPLKRVQMQGGARRAE
jgi:hypothetical protein